MTDEPEPIQVGHAAGVGLNPLLKIENTAPKGWRMKLANAAAQLIAGSEKGALAYGEIRERLDTIEGRSIVAKGMADAVLQQAVHDPEMMERAKARFLGSAMQKQENLEAVILGATAPLIALPAPEVTQNKPDAKERSVVDETDSVTDQSPDEPLNSDWAATFTGIAENATSNELRERLSRILAGELASPGTYSRATVRQIAELEKADLEAMQNVLGFVIGDAILRLGKGDDVQPTIDMLLPLAEAGLVAEATNMLSKLWPPTVISGQLMFVTGKTWALGVTKKDQSLSVPMTQLTRAGVAVVDLLGRVDEQPILRRFAETLDPVQFPKIGLGRLIASGRVRTPLTSLRPAPVTNSLSVQATASPLRPPLIDQVIPGSS